jgi:beta-1,4-mannosyltransferase
MQYHAVSLAAIGHEVDMVGLAGEALLPALVANPRVHCHRLPDRAFSRHGGGAGRFVIASLARAIGQGAGLFRTLMRLPKPDVILVQNPPAVPALAVAWLAARLRGSRLIIDWHNLAHTIAAIRLGPNHRAVKAVARSERRWARRADGHLAVSQALAAWLAREYGITAAVLHDRPPNQFGAPQPAAASALWGKVAGEMSLGPERLPLVVCPTSWTPDEDFDLLLEALERADRQLSKTAGGRVVGPDARAPAPSILVVLTGRGTLRAAFEARAARRHFSAVAVRCMWFEPADYPVIVGIADLGLCLHQSSSGLDLPMKVADFRGAGVPVAAFDYAPVLGEVLSSGKEGITFRDPGELARLFVALASGHVESDSPLGRSRAWLSQHLSPRWDAEWQAAALPVIIQRRH